MHAIQSADRVHLLRGWALPERKAGRLPGYVLGQPLGVRECYIQGRVQEDTITESVRACTRQGLLFNVLGNYNHRRTDRM